MATWEDVRELGLELPAAEESTAYRQPCLRVAGKSFANMSPHEPGALVLRCDPAERGLMVAARPSIYSITPHYDAWPLVLVRLQAIERDELRERLAESWLARAPRRLVEAFDADSGAQ